MGGVVWHGVGWYESAYDAKERRNIEDSPTIGRQDHDGIWDGIAVEAGEGEEKRTRVK